MRITIRALLMAACGLVHGAAAAPPDPAVDYRVPNDAIVRLLTATQTPQALLHGASGRLALAYRETLLPLERVARPHHGLAGYWLDPRTRTSGTESWVQRVEIIDARSGATLARWEPPGAPALDELQFSPDGSQLSATSFRDSVPRLVLFDIASGRERTLEVALNPAFESPCDWSGPHTLVCRLVPDERAAEPAPYPAPNVLDHPGGKAPVRTYGNLLDGAWEEALFEHYFSATLALVQDDGSVRRIEDSTGLLARVRPAPDGRSALVIRLQRPYSHLFSARQFPRSVELWDLARGKRIDAPALPQRHDITPTRGQALPAFAWKPDGTLGWIEPVAGGGERWMTLAAPYRGKARELTRHLDGIGNFGWTSAGTAYFANSTEHGTRVRYFLAPAGRAPLQLWEGAVKDIYDNPGRPLRRDGDRGPVLEQDGRVLIASDGLGDEGPRPRVEALDLETLATEHVLAAAPGVYERVVGVLDPAARGLLSVRESETEPPALYALQGEQRTLVKALENPFPDLDRVERRTVVYPRADGVQLNGMLYLPPEHRLGKPLPTLIWIYPAEFSDPEQAGQIDARRFRFHQVKGPSPIAVTLAGYALLLNPTMPIVGEGEAANDAYVPQLVASAEAAIDYLVANGITDRKRVAVAGRSYGAFSTANLLVNTQLFRTGIAFSGAYNRTLTPFGFQHEKRSFWKATEFYTRMSPFFHADEIDEPLLLMHGAADDNPGTPALQARRFFHALVGNGARVRYVELPYERHHYRARENVLHAAAEMIDWLDHTIGPAAP